MTDEAACRSGFDPSAARALIALVDALPGELGDRAAGAGRVSDVEPGPDGNEPHLALQALDLQGGGREEIERILIPEIHLGDPPATLEGRRQRGELAFRHSAHPVISFGIRVRL